MAKKIRTAEPQQKFTGSYKKKRVYCFRSKLLCVCVRITSFTTSHATRRVIC